MDSDEKYVKSKNNGCELESKHGKYKNEFSTFVKDGKTWIDNRGFVLATDFDSLETLEHHTVERYIGDAIAYMLIDIWPETRFCDRNSIWLKYYCNQLRDLDVALDKYFDFDYDVSNWPRESLIELIEDYGESVLFPFSIYSEKKVNMPFDDWYKLYFNEVDLESVLSVEKYFNSNSKDKNKKTYKLRRLAPRHN